MKAVAHWLLTAFMAVNLTWGHEWVHLPRLWAHYQEHSQKDADLGFAAFIALHYADRDHAGSDRDHQELPFQQHKDHGGVDHVFFAPAMSAGASHRPPTPAGARGPVDGPRDGHRRSTLQPPRG
ncbi:MAG: hypothetical protein ACK4L7_11015 [Flavobacteriales bacterium]